MQSQTLWKQIEQLHHYMKAMFLEDLLGKKYVKL